MLRCEFKGLPGEQKVLHGDFIIMNSRIHGMQISKEAWQQSVFPGTEIKMSIIMQALRARTGSCPKPRCFGKAASWAEGTVVHCPECGLAVIPQRAEKAYQLGEENATNDTTDPACPLSAAHIPRRIMFLRGRPYSVTHSRSTLLDATARDRKAEEENRKRREFSITMDSESHDIMMFRMIHLRQCFEPNIVQYTPEDSTRLSSKRQERREKVP